MKKQKRTLTLFEVMIVILLITLIGGVLGYNMKGSLDKGKVFRSKQAREQLHDMLLLALAEGKPASEIEANPEKVLDELKLAKNPDALLKDGWGSPFVVKAIYHGTDFSIDSVNKNKYDK
jgi:general secretion pathway protein G